MFFAFSIPGLQQQYTTPLCSETTREKCTGLRVYTKHDLYSLVIVINAAYAANTNFNETTCEYFFNPNCLFHFHNGSSGRAHAFHVLYNIIAKFSVTVRAKWFRIKCKFVSFCRKKNNVC